MASRLSIRRTRRPTKMRLRKPPWIDPFPQIPGTEPEKRIFAALVKRKVYFIFQGQIPEFEKGGTNYFMKPVGYKPDFVLPEYKLIIDPFSPFHHSQPKAVLRDEDKVAKYEYVGYHYYHPWAVAPGVFTFDQALIRRSFYWHHVTINGVDYKYKDFHLRKRGKKGLRGQFHGADGLLAMIPELGRPPIRKLTDPRDIKAKKLQGYRIGEFVGAGANSVGAANRKRRKPPKLTIRYRKR